LVGFWGFSHLAIAQWTKALGEEGTQIKRHAAQILELNALYSYVGHKNYGWVLLLLIDLANAFFRLSLASEALKPEHDDGRPSRFR